MTRLRKYLQKLRQRRSLQMKRLQMKPTAMKDGERGMPPAMPEVMEGKQPPANVPKDMPKPPEGGAGFSKMPNKAGIGDAPLTIVILQRRLRA